MSLEEFGKDVAEGVIDELVELVIRAVTEGGVPSSRIRQLLEDEMTEAANRQMKKELGP